MYTNPPCVRDKKLSKYLGAVRAKGALINICLKKPLSRQSLHFWRFLPLSLVVVWGACEECGFLRPFRMKFKTIPKNFLILSSRCDAIGGCGVFSVCLFSDGGKCNFWAWCIRFPAFSRTSSFLLSLLFTQLLDMSLECFERAEIKLSRWIREKRQRREWVTQWDEMLKGVVFIKWNFWVWHVELGQGWASGESESWINNVLYNF